MMGTDSLFMETALFNNLPNVKMTISQYDHLDCEIGRYTGTFTSIFDNIPNFERYYYRVATLGKSDIQGRVSSKHFGVRVTSIGGFKVSEESFINSFLNNNVKEYAKRKECGSVQTIDFNFSYEMIHDFWFIDRMRTLSQNTSKGFNCVLNCFLSKFKEFQPLENLNDLDRKNGIYLLVLDEYNVCYIGQANDMRTRIMRHWSRNDYFSGTGIDMFKAKDTTRIYYALTEKKRQTNSLEHRAISEMPSRYTLNCMAGGDIDYLTENACSISKAPSTDNDFVDYVLQDYDIPGRINSNIGKFIVSSL